MILQMYGGEQELDLPQGDLYFGRRRYRRKVYGVFIPDEDEKKDCAEMHLANVFGNIGNGHPAFILNEDFSGANAFKSVSLDILLHDHNQFLRVISIDDVDERVKSFLNASKSSTVTRNLVYRKNGRLSKTERNKFISRELYEILEEANGRVPDFALLTGLCVRSSKKSDRGLDLIFDRTYQFEFLRDDRLSSKYNGWYFSDIDVNGLPKGLSKEKMGNNRIWWTSEERVSRIDVVQDGSINCGNPRLDQCFQGSQTVLVYQKEI